MHTREADIASGAVGRSDPGLSRRTALPVHAMVRMLLTETKARKWLESAMRPDGPVSPHCRSKRAWRFLDEFTERLSTSDLDTLDYMVTLARGWWQDPDQQALISDNGLGNYARKRA